MNLAMWSGPRNLSTALMYAFAARGDCTVWDEPFYAAYLDRTGLDHPMRAEIMDAGLRDPADVARRCASGANDKPLFYQKHMCQHMIAEMPRDWMEKATHVFLIRHPARVLASFAAKYEAAGLDDIGFVQQESLYQDAAKLGDTAPIVIDSSDILADPEAALRALCAALGIEYRNSMTSWPAGPKPFDGVWAPVWYASVHASTGFHGSERPLPKLEAPYDRIAEAALPYYERMRARALRIPKRKAD
ncbi:hypothetical protein FIU97_05845 [Roseivivax sp. THAF40]|uniref:sulfotransferase-like domain-containing protein n=1 Tax=unclassified Roseivivax TaxID=2639302 RepID=UPI0012696E39|nr:MULTISPECIES: HAD family hydrolase [unclassified Roseivivax]QFS82302.1 hypothetical protein FIV09_05635 [Roseivivax sp. THAF197b]QFT46093.1 hypothetical protein FIU97_05845 [Roseivivax sp. THAF40]